MGFSPPRATARFRSLLGLLVGLTSAFVLQSQAVAQDSKSASLSRPVLKLSATGPRSSPFNPPDKDVFLTDASPGLDTGCTFNTSPLNPLTIDVPVDRFVGDVDANGYLVNPAPLIAAGIIPASVDIVLPAFDIDFNGSPPPERDELLFNGQSLGLLTGDNNVWKLNSFRVDIRKIKFPSRPAPGAQPVPVNNRVQIRIDTLGVERWCTQIDWVALVLPIRPKLALDLDVVSGNPVVSDDGSRFITRIQEQRFDANCNVTTPIGPADDYPFSGPALTAGGGAGSAKVRAKIKVCPEGSMKPPAVTADWSVDGTAKRGTLNWTGFEKEVEFGMPGAIGAYTAKLKLKLDNGQEISADRKLYVTRKAPLVANPRIHWYKKGVEWANGESAETSIVSKVRTGLYGYGRTSWKYGYISGGKCNWTGLMGNPLTCNYSDCYVFSDVLENISKTLGVGGMSAETVVGNNPGAFWRFLGWPGEPFLTTNSPSLDPAFPGSARPALGGAYNRYIFSSHSLLKRDGVFHDATFNKAYTTPRAFIVANFNSNYGTDSIGYYQDSDEGPRLYANADPTPPVPYAAWGTYSYALTPPPPLPTPGANRMVAAAAAASLVAFPSVAAWRTPDANSDGRFDAVEVDVNVDILVGGRYAVIGRLQTPGGELVSNTPSFQSSQITRATVAGNAGRAVMTLRFSGEQIRYASADGPWNLVLYANGQSGPAGTASLVTPAYKRSDFGERKALLRSLIATPIDADGSGKYELVRLNTEIDVLEAGPYQISATIVGAGSGLGAQTRQTMLSTGVQPISVDLPATAILRSGIDGPYEVTLNLSDMAQANLGSAQTVLQGYFANQFEGVVDVSPTLSEQAIDSNGNRLYDLLRVGADVKVRANRAALVYATLEGSNGASVAAEVGASFRTGPAQRINLDFSGPQIRSLNMDSAYKLNLSFRDPSTFEEFDAVQLTLRGVYTYAQFDTSEPVRAIALTGTQTDRGIDTNGNSLFERLQVDLGVQLLNAGTYEWSGRLVDRNGVEIAFAVNRASLPAGTTALRLEFDGRAIGTNGFDGPYFLRSLLVAGPGGANLVSPYSGETSAWQARQFEGFAARAPGDINGDGSVDSRDVDAFNRAFGSTTGEPNYNRFADFDRDGRITLNDLRLFRRYVRN
jgi:Dockerin type I domain